MKEIDLYSPVKQFLEGQGYEVKGEIHECDVMALRGSEEPLVVELKLAFSLDVLLQAVNRLSVSSVVYIGIPSTCKAFRKRRRHAHQAHENAGARADSDIDKFKAEPGGGGPRSW